MGEHLSGTHRRINWTKREASSPVYHKGSQWEGLWSCKSLLFYLNEPPPSPRCSPFPVWWQVEFLREWGCFLNCFEFQSLGLGLTQRRTRKVLSVKVSFPSSLAPTRWGRKKTYLLAGKPKCNLEAQASCAFDDLGFREGHSNLAHYMSTWSRELQQFLFLKFIKQLITSILLTSAASIRHD